MPCNTVLAYLSVHSNEVVGKVLGDLGAPRVATQPLAGAEAQSGPVGRWKPPAGKGVQE